MSLDVPSLPRCSECPIRHRAVCARCDSDELARLEQIKIYKSFKAGDPILWSGDEMDYVSTVVEGVASLGKTMEDGRTQMVGLLFPSDFIGKPGRVQIGFDVVAVTDITLCCFQRKAFENMIETTPHIAQRLLEMSLDELDSAREWMLLLGRKTAREKIATFIKMLVQREQKGRGQDAQAGFSLPLTRSEIANYLGLTLETVSRQLGIMKKEGTLQFSDRKRFNIGNFGALHRASGDDI